MDKAKPFIITAELRELEKQVATGEISYGRMVELLNEKAQEYATSLPPGKQEASQKYTPGITMDKDIYGNPFSQPFPRTAIEDLGEAIQKQEANRQDKKASDEEIEKAISKAPLWMLTTKDFQLIVEGAKFYRDNFPQPQEIMYTEEDMKNCFNESRLTHPMIGFKHLSFKDFIENQSGERGRE